MDIKIDNMPYPKISTVHKSKYADLFDSLKVGQCLKLSADKKEIGRVTAALRKYLDRKGEKGYSVKSIQKCDDGFGRIWLLPKPKKPVKMADVPGRKIINLG